MVTSAGCIAKRAYSLCKKAHASDKGGDVLRFCAHSKPVQQGILHIRLFLASQPLHLLAPTNESPPECISTDKEALVFKNLASRAIGSKSY